MDTTGVTTAGCGLAGVCDDDTPTRLTSITREAACDATSGLLGACDLDGEGTGRCYSAAGSLILGTCSDDSVAAQLACLHLDTPGTWTPATTEAACGAIDDAVWTHTATEAECLTIGACNDARAVTENECMPLGEIFGTAGEWTPAVWTPTTTTWSSEIGRASCRERV